MVRMTTRIKRAELGGDGKDTSFEQSFSNLAHAFLKDKAPTLLDYEAGFQLLERDQDNTKAVGIFGFKVGQQWLYAPVFFLNGDLKGSELLYIKAQDQFVPLKENWLNYLLQRKPNVLGRDVQPNLGRLGVLSPDLQAFSRPPSKFASYHLADGKLRVKTASETHIVPENMVPGVAAFAHFATTSPFNDEKYASVTDLPTFLKQAGKEVLTTLVLDMMEYPGLADGFTRFYGGLGIIQDAIKEAKARESRFNDILEKEGLNQFSFGSFPRDQRGQMPSKRNGGVLSTGFDAFRSLDSHVRGNADTRWNGDDRHLKAAGPFDMHPNPAGELLGPGPTAAPMPHAAPVPQTPELAPTPHAAPVPQTPELAPMPHPAGGVLDTGAGGDIGGAEPATAGPQSWAGRHLGTANEWLGNHASFLPSGLPGGRATSAILGLGAAGMGVGYMANRRRKSRDEMLGELMAKHAGNASFKRRGPKGPFEQLVGKDKKKPVSSNIGSAMAKMSKLTVLTATTIGQRGVFLDPTDEEKKKIRVDGVAFRDDRPENSIAYEIQTELRLTSPQESGIYYLLTQPTSFERVAIIVGPQSDEGRKDFATVVCLDSNKKWLNIHPANLWTRSQETSPTEYNDWLKTLTTVGKIKPSNSAMYMLVGPRGEATTPFQVYGDRGGDESSQVYEVSFRDYAERGRPSNFPKIQSNSSDYWSSGCGSDTLLVVTNKEGGRIRTMHRSVYVPGDYKLITLRPDTDKEDDRPRPYRVDSSSPSPLLPGTQLDITRSIYEKTSSLHLEHSGTVLKVNDVPMDPDYALIHLVRDWGFREKMARDLVKIAKAERRCDFQVDLVEGLPKDPASAHLADLQLFDAWLKTAAPGDPMDPTMSGTVTAPGFPSPPTGMEPTLTGGVNAIYPQQETQPVMTPGSMNMNPGANDIRTPPDPRTMAVGMQAAQTGQKEVFDTAMVGSLLRAVRSDTMVDKNLGDMMKGLDRLGRVLFSYYWHGEEFQERYGKKDMPELEDSLRNAFEQMGDVVLFLMQKTIQPFPDETSNVDLGSTAEA